MRRGSFNALSRALYQEIPRKAIERPNTCKSLNWSPSRATLPSTTNMVLSCPTTCDATTPRSFTTNKAVKFKTQALTHEVPTAMTSGPLMLLIKDLKGSSPSLHPDHASNKMPEGKLIQARTDIGSKTGSSRSSLGAMSSNCMTDLQARTKAARMAKATPLREKVRSEETPSMTPPQMRPKGSSKPLSRFRPTVRERTAP
mmetsp:Transcript_6834/g.12721  ORF Transcript_6834/g.12721 Transcript_6834/m.12721 type:complete len:200 (+) Transcript_6834:102-701(+)